MILWVSVQILHITTFLYFSEAMRCQANRTASVRHTLVIHFHQDYRPLRHSHSHTSLTHPNTADLTSSPSVAAATLLAS